MTKHPRRGRPAYESPPKREEWLTDTQVEAVLQRMWNEFCVRPQQIIMHPALRKFAARLLCIRRAHIGGCSARSRKRALRTLWRRVRLT